MKSRPIKPLTHIGMKDAAFALDVTIAKLNYLCKTGRIDFITSEKGTRWFDPMTLDILPKPELKASKASSVPEGYKSVKEVAEMMGCSTQKVYRLIKAGKIKAATFKWTKRICIDPRFLEIDGVAAFNVAPQISAPQPVSEVLKNIDTELNTLISMFTTIESFLASSSQNAEECFEDESIAYAKNALMFRIQEMIIAVDY